MLRPRSGRLNALAELTNSQHYLEIGVHRGNTLRAVTVPQKVAVDPMFKFDTAAEEDGGSTSYYEVTSDTFFAEHARNHGQYDLIYLDGLHTFDQTFRDFCASQAVAHDSTVWLIDDTRPVDFISATPDQQRASKLRKQLRDDEGSWMGDVFKVIFALHDFFPQFSYATFRGHGQTAVWLETRADFAPKWGSLEAISRVDYREFVENEDELMRYGDDDTILDAIRASRGESLTKPEAVAPEVSV